MEPRLPSSLFPRARTSVFVGAFALLALACGGAPKATAVAQTPAPSAAPIPRAVEAPPPGQLPKDVRPTHYALDLLVNPDGDRFLGRVRINVDLDQPKGQIWLHGLDLNVTRAVALVGAETINATWQQSNVEGVAAFVPERPLAQGQAILEIEYDAPFNRHLRGLYKVKSEGRAYAFTQFESISARSAFPCFDEPAFKTPYDVTLTASAAHQAIANTTETGRTPVGNGYFRATFARTEKLPTYLLAWAVGPLDVVEHTPIAPTAARSRPLPFRGVATYGKGPLLKTALEQTGAIVASLENYFGIEYPYDKLDIIAVPDFASGAMENAGAITFREWLLLIDPDTADERQRRAFAGVMAHELAHQWFGDLVTMPWWDDIWLNEAFATWMGTRTVADVYPEYESLISAHGGVVEAMRMDSLTSARRIRQPIDTSHDIQNAFDSITYRKGGGVLGMFERFLGAETFRRGIQNYLNEHRFGSATASDLLRALDTAAGKPVSKSFSTFLEQPGVPLIEAELTCNAGAASVKLTQSRYFPLGSPGAVAQTWSLPVCMRYSANGKTAEKCHVLEAPSEVVPLDSAACPSWVMLNAEGAGYYRWLLDETSLAKLRDHGFKELSPRERLSFADSLLSGFDAGKLSPKQVYPTLKLLTGDTSRAVSEAPMRFLEYTRNYLVDASERKRVEDFGRALYSPTFKRLGLSERPGEAGETKLQRLGVLKFLADTARDPAVIQQAEQLAKGFLALKKGERSKLPRELIALVLEVYVRHGGAAAFNDVEARFFATEHPMLRNAFLGALGAAESPEESKRALELAFDERLRVNEITSTLGPQMSQPETRDQAFAWLEQNIGKLLDRVAVTRAGDLPWRTSSFCSEEAAKRVEALFSPHVHKMMGGPRNLAGALESIRICAARLNKQKAETQAFFAAMR